MSCRVISRRLEEFVLDRLVEVAGEAGLTRLSGRYVPTKKNGLVAEHYETLGFRQVGEENGRELGVGARRRGSRPLGSPDREESRA